MGVWDHRKKYSVAIGAHYVLRLTLRNQIPRLRIFASRSARLCGCSYRGSLWHYTPFFTPVQRTRPVARRTQQEFFTPFAAASFISRALSPRRFQPRTPFTIYTTDTAARCTVQPTPRYSFIPLPQLSLS